MQQPCHKGSLTALHPNSPAKTRVLSTSAYHESKYCYHQSMPHSPQWCCPRNNGIDSNCIVHLTKSWATQTRNKSIHFVMCDFSVEHSNSQHRSLFNAFFCSAFYLALNAPTDNGKCVFSDTKPVNAQNSQERARA